MASGEPIRLSIVADRSCSMKAEQQSTVLARSRQTIMAAAWDDISNNREGDLMLLSWLLLVAYVMSCQFSLQCLIDFDGK